MDVGVNYGLEGRGEGTVRSEQWALRIRQICSS